MGRTLAALSLGKFVRWTCVYWVGNGGFWQQDTGEIRACYVDDWPVPIGLGETLLVINQPKRVAYNQAIVWKQVPILLCQS